MKTIDAPLRVIASRNHVRDGVDLFVAVAPGPGLVPVVHSPVHAAQFVTTDEGVATEPTLFLRRPEAQELFEDLWDAGLRPTKAVDYLPGAIEKMAQPQLATTQALQDHIADLRSLADRVLSLVERTIYGKDNIEAK